MSDTRTNISSWSDFRFPHENAELLKGEVRDNLNVSRLVAFQGTDFISERFFAKISKDLELSPPPKTTPSPFPRKRGFDCAFVPRDPVTSNVITGIKQYFSK